MAPSPGDTILQFRVVEPIGSGAMGSVWRAVDTTLGRDVALKILPDALAEDASLRSRFQREARLLASLNHPNVAGVYGVHEADGTHFLSMEYVPGEDLSDRLQRGSLPVEEVVPIVARIADGLQAAHENGVVHRDLKPGNVRITPDGRVKVLDFGLAKSVGRPDADRDDDDRVDPSVQTTAGMVLGTAPYMSPEQARGAPVDARSDIWSFGCVLWECVVGERPFAGDTMSDVLAAILHQEPDWSRLPATVPPSVRCVLARCLAKNPRDRLHHVADARLELEGPAVPGLAESLAATATPTSAHARRARVAIAALAAALVALSLLLAVTLLRGDVVPGAIGPSPFVNPLADARPIKLTSYPGSEFDAAISHDGRYVVFVADRDGPYEVFVATVGSGAVHRLPLADKRPRDIRARVRNVGFVGTGSRIWLGGGWTGEGMLQSESLHAGPFRKLLTKDAVNVAWTPDGRRMVYHYGDGGDPVYVADGAGLDPEELPFESAEGYHQHYPAWSWDGEWVYVVRGWETTGNVDLWRTRADGTGEPQRLTEGKRGVAYPTPIDERTVLYVAEDADGGGPWLWALDLETRTSHRAAIGAERYSSVSASMDGSRIVATVVDPRARLWSVPIPEEGLASEEDAKPYDVSSERALAPRFRGAFTYYLSSRGAGDGLWRHRPGDAPQQIWSGRNGVLIEPPAISPAGDRVALTIRRGGEARLFLMASDGGPPAPLAEELTPRGAADWAPEGDRIVVGGTVGNVNGLYVVGCADGSVERLFTGEALNPVWSPIGDVIAFAGRQVQAFTPLLAMNAETGEPIDLPEIPLYRGGERFRFTPDGTAIVYMFGSSPGQDFYRLDLADRATRRLTALDRAVESKSFDLTPDGKRIVFDRRSLRSDIVLFERSVER